jgi:hypothetical protein
MPYFSSILLRTTLADFESSTTSARLAVITAPCMGCSEFSALQPRRVVRLQAALDDGPTAAANRRMGSVRNHRSLRRDLLPPVLLAVATLCPLATVRAASRLELVADRVGIEAIAAQQVRITVAPAGGSALSISFRAARVGGLPGTGPLTDVRVECPRLVPANAGVTCQAGHLSGDFGVVGRQDTPFGLSLGGSGRHRVSLPELAFAGGRAALGVELQARRWRVTADFSALDLGRLAGTQPLAAWVPAGFTAAGQARGTLEAAGSAAAPASVRVQAAVASLAFANEAGTIAGEGLGFELGASLVRAPRTAGWVVDARLDAAAGQAYLDPVFADLGARPVKLQFGGRLAEDAKALSVDSFRFQQRGVGAIDGAAELHLAGETLLGKARIVLKEVDLAGAWPVYGRPFLISTQFADLEAIGHVAGEIDVDGGLPSRVEVDLDGVVLDSATGSLGVEGLSGHMSWFDERTRNELAQRVDSAVFKSLLAWNTARLWGIEFGPAEIPFTTTGNNFRLLDPVLLPVFDGGLAVTTLRMRNAGTPQMYLRFDAELKPVSIAPITRALGWPEFSGTLAGRIPRLELAEGLVTLGGNIEAEVFDGKVTVRNLRLRDPLGQYPRLFADIDIEGLELEQVTRTFEFGMITGRLSGQVASLETFDWMPVAFDAKFHTTPGDRSPHRISQRAVTNLSKIGGGSGGGVAAALQGGFLRFFDTFGYDRLGLSCRLANDICTMDGVAPAGSGYYIVKGSGLPRIDVIGSQRRVAWTRLVRQLSAIARSPGPVVE